MDHSISRVSLGTSHPGGLVPKPKARRETEDGHEFERELKGESHDGETETDSQSDKPSNRTDRNISPLADGDPGSLLDLTA